MHTPEPHAHRPLSLWVALLLAFLITAAQIAFAISVQDRRDKRSAYLHLFGWDSEHYLEIAENGYRSTIPSPYPTDFSRRQLVYNTNVALFPGYPVAIWLFMMVTRLPGRWAALLVAQLCAVGFWTYLLLYLRRWGASCLVTGIAVAALVASPAGFFLITPYSESLFFFSFLGYLYWSESASLRGSVLTGLHGFVLTATRLFGVPLTLYPLLRDTFRTQGMPLRERARFLVRPTVIAIVASLAIFLFLLYCAVRFHHWDLYFKRQEWGWGIRTDYVAFFRDGWRLLVPGFTYGGKSDVNYHSRITASVMLWLLLLTSTIEIAWGWWKKSRGQMVVSPVRTSLLVLSWTTFYLLFSSLFGTGFQSMTRYAFSIELLLVLWAAHIVTKEQLPIELQQRTHKILQGVVIASVVVGCVLCLLLQAEFVYRFTRGDWVA